VKCIALFICIVLFGLTLSGCILNDQSDKPIIEEPLIFDISGRVYHLVGDIEISLNNESFISLTNFLPIDFIFEGGLESGETYSVVITKQPESQWCKVKNGNGLIETEDIKNIYVVCHTFFRGLKGVSEVSTGRYHTCAIVDNNVVCWGSNRDGQTDVPANLVNPRKISSGGTHTCVLDDTGVVCWGKTGDTGITKVAPPEGLVNVRELNSGYFSSCVIDDSGLQCFGNEEISNLTSYPKNLEDPHGLTVKGSNACVIDGKKPLCWGYNSGAYTLPDDLFEVDSIDIGQTSGCALTTGEVTCWDDSGKSSSEITGEVDLSGSSTLALNFIDGCVVTDIGLKCWGPDLYGVHGLQHIVKFPSQLSFNYIHGCVIENEELICAGDNYFGQIAIPNK